MTAKSKIPWFPVLLVLLTGSLLVPWEPEHAGRLARSLLDSLHFPLAAVWTIALIRVLSPRLSPRKAATVAVILSLVLAGLFECIQPLVGRSRELLDLCVAAAGSVATAAWWLSARAGRDTRTILRGVAVVLLLLALAPVGLVIADNRRAERDFPLLASFESPLEAGRWRGHGCRVSRTREHATHGAFALRLESLPGAEYPGIFLPGPHDWTSMSELRFDVFLDAEVPGEVWVRIDDRPGPPYADRFQRRVRLAPGSNRVAIAREEIRTDSGRALDLGEVVQFSIFFAEARGVENLYLDHVILGVDVDR